jgi:peptidyl-prolyl cis-trans isomerase B (cyclophilin B)
VTTALLLLIFALALPFIAACSSSSSEAMGSAAAVAGDQAKSDAASDTAESADQPAATPGEVPLYTPSYKANGKEIAVIKTAKGDIKLKFYPADAPNHVAAFIELAKKGFYDGTKFHRVEPGFVIQGGDPLSKTDDPMVGTGGPGYNLKAEFDPATNKQKHLDGTLAMARSKAPDSAGSQFYITLGPQPMLDGQYTVFGQVVEGMDVVRSIQVGDVMESVTIENAN